MSFRGNAVFGAETLHLSSAISEHPRQREQSANKAQRESWGIHINKKRNLYRKLCFAGGFTVKRTRIQILPHEGHRTLDN